MTETKHHYSGRIFHLSFGRCSSLVVMSFSFGCMMFAFTAGSVERERSISLLFDQGWNALPQVMAVDSKGHARVPASIEARAEGRIVEKVPTWLLGTEGGEGVEISIVRKRFLHMFGGVRYYVFDIEEKPEWEIYYYAAYVLPTNDILSTEYMLDDLYTMEHFRRSGVPNMANLVYFSQRSIMSGNIFDIVRTINVAFVIYEKRAPLVAALQYSWPQNSPRCFSVGQFLYDARYFALLTFEQRSSLAREVTEWGLLMRDRLGDVLDFVWFFDEMTIDIDPITGEMALYPPAIAYPLIPSRQGESLWFRNYNKYKFLVITSHILHGHHTSNNRLLMSYIFIDDWLLRLCEGTFYLRSNTPKGFAIEFSRVRFLPLEKMIAGEPLFGLEQIRASFAEYYRYFKSVLDEPPNVPYQPGTLLSIDDFLHLTTLNLNI